MTKNNLIFLFGLLFILMFGIGFVTGYIWKKAEKQTSAYEIVNDALFNINVERLRSIENDALIQTINDRGLKLP